MCPGSRQTARVQTGPPAATWAFPDPRWAPPDGPLALGGDLAPGTLLAAYRAGIFPMPLGRRLAWWSPDPRAVLPLDGLHVSRSLRRSVRRHRVTVDAAFDRVVSGCADPARQGRWITPAVRHAYGELHQLGWAHSVEAWDLEDGELVGGLYGVACGGLFAGESMFHRRRDASKVALVALVDLLCGGDPAAAQAEGRLLDCQWLTPHLRTLGAVEIPREEYLRRLARALLLPPPAAFHG